MKQQNSFWAPLKNIVEIRKSYIDGKSPLLIGTDIWCAWVYNDLGINMIASTKKNPFKIR